MTVRQDIIDFQQTIIHTIGSIADEYGFEVYVVGGYVRDKLLGKEVKDIDFVVIGDGIAFAKLVATKFKRKNIVTYETFGTAMLQLDDGKIEFVAAREERYDADSRKPHVKRTTLESDLSRRDFTINAIAASINKKTFGEIADPFDGRSDLEEEILRTPLAPEQTFDDDPLRMMRALRFVSQLYDPSTSRRFIVQPETREAIKKKAERIVIVSKERTTDEFLKILASPKPSIGLKLLYETGLASYVFPELVDMVGVEQRKDYHHKDVFLHTLKVVDNISTTTDDVWLRFTALAHDIAKPRTKAFKEGIGWTFHGHEDLGARMMKPIFRRMRFPMDKLPYVEKLVRLHLRPMVLVSEEVTDSAIRRLLFESGNDIDDLMALCRADITSQNPNRVARYLKNYDIVMQKMQEVEEKDQLRNWQPPVRGDEIMQVCGIQPGPLVGILKKRIEEAILDGQIPNEHDAALEYLLSIKGQVLQEHS
ncbi:MAG: HD domain-containing protein [Ignavibacteriae bacterium]|nr:HD domain-containing protein [Ignavibacteria bacterium]MBI3365925.1 HD domain-containing protein [Ignavibacteriota bacterium]